MDLAILKVLAVIVCVISTVVNCAVVVTVFQARKQRAINILIANWSLLTCFTSLFSLFALGNGERLVQNVWTCPIISFLRNWMVNMYPLHVLAIIYEACSQLKPRFGNLLILRTICLSWILPGVGSMYSLLGTTFSARISVPIFGNVGLGIILEILRALFFHLGSPACMTYLLYKSRGKLKYLKTLKVSVSKNPITLEKLKRVRFILSYSMFFIIFWVPFGLLFTFYRIFEAFRKSSASGEQNQDLKKSTSDSLSLITIGLYTGIACFYIYIVFSPVIVLWTGDGRLRQQFVNLLRRGACEVDNNRYWCPLDMW
ncbi:hypothetical protein Fcan01_20491 [Folsomia candida]|uniref:G-protein coupled receptors family 1 profile domain-containing protein n=1 Tax=Folsomia candida TaxID=158441 RepID=A0A226DIQ0_FOLCA|nr:hypothetical protein Fcan01_20491 [Folsomia candida]